MLQFMYCDGLDGLSHVGGSVGLGFRFVVWFAGWACGPYWLHLRGRYPEIPLGQFAGVGRGFWYHEEGSA